MAVLQVFGKCPVEIDALMMLVINGDIKSLYFFINLVGPGSSAHCLLGAALMCILTSSTLTSLEELKWKFPQLGNCGVNEVPSRMSFTFFSIKSRYSCAEKSGVALYFSSPSNVLTDFQVLRASGAAADIFDLQYAEDFACDNRPDWWRADVHASRDWLCGATATKIRSRRSTFFRIILDSSSNHGLWLRWRTVTLTTECICQEDC